MLAESVRGDRASASLLDDAFATVIHGLPDRVGRDLDRRAGGAHAEGAVSGAVRITKENYQANLASTWALAFLVEEAPLEEMLAACEHADAIGAIVDPTAYRDKAAALHEDMEMLRALLHVQTTLASIRRRRATR